MPRDSEGVDPEQEHEQEQSGIEATPSFESWYRQEHPRLLATMTVASGDLDVARDVTAEAFARALERWDRVGTMESPNGWAYRVALNVWRRRQRRLALERSLLRRLPPEPQAPPPLAVEVWDAVRALPPRTRAAVALRYLGGFSEREVADAMGIAPGTVAASLHAARKRLAAVLDDDRVDKEVSRG